jgi:uncharacterized membrane protein YgcG
MIHREISLLTIPRRSKLNRSLETPSMIPCSTSPSRQQRLPMLQKWFTMRMVFVLFSTMMMSVLAATTDFYQLLGISRDASSKEIKKAYRAKSLEFHPDKNKEEGAAEKFARIARAYEVLSNEDLKSVYDRHGEEGLERHEQRGGGGGGGGGFEDIFEQFGFRFGGGGGGRRGRDDGEQATESIQMPIHLSLRQLYLGASFDLSYTRQVLCLQWEMCVKSQPVR